MDILLLILIGLIIYVCYKHFTKCNTVTDTFNNQAYEKQKKKIRKNNDDYNFDAMFDLDDGEIHRRNDGDFRIDDNNNNNNKNKNNNKNNNKKKTIKPHFTEMQFHTDYRDTITSFNDLAPSQKEIFNEANYPVTQKNITSDEYSKIKNIVKEFVKQLNKNTKFNVRDVRTPNTGWDEPALNPSVKSGWEKQQEELGLPTSLYNDPAKKAKINLIKIDDIEVFTTGMETKYVCTIIIQKVNVNDQMIVKINFVQKLNINEERGFFDDIDPDSIDNTRNIKMNDIIVEEIFVAGYLSDSDIQKGDVNDDFYNFDALKTSDFISDKIIMNELVKKYKNKHTDDLKFVGSLDEQGRVFHNDLPDLTTYDSFKCTRSIYEDLNGVAPYYE
jgi:hypothetical protein